MNGHPDKICVICGRRIEWRKKWERDWETVKYCSKSCRSRTLDGTDRALEESIVSLLRSRAGGGSICPSEAAKAVGGEDEKLWRPLMERTREAARRLTNAGRVQITQRNSVVNPSTAKGPIRVRLAR
ncbi:MAG: DUF2256 and DUF3253 domain-containing protein [Planctomycetota bacterium]